MISYSVETGPSKILVVEDDSIISKGIERQLKALGYGIAGLANSAEEAIEMAFSQVPSLILMDINLGEGLDGVEVASRIRQKLDVPVVFLTAHADQATLERAKQTGPFGYVVKPYEAQDLKIAIEIGLQRHHLERQARDREKWLGATLASLGDGVIATDERARIRFLNEAAETITGWSLEAAEGSDLDDVFRIKSAEQPLREALARGQMVELPRDGVLIDRAGVEKPVEATAAPIKSLDGGGSGAVLVFRDVTRQRNLEKALEESIASLRQSNQWKDFVLGMAAHDLRNPLNIISVYTDYLKEQTGEFDSLSPTQLLDRIQRASRDMLRLVEDLLDMTALESGKLTFSLERLDLRHLVRLNCEAHRHLAAPKNIDVELALPDDALLVDVDAQKVDQVLTNLVTNAIKYSKPGTKVQVGLRSFDAMAEVRVTDQGPGVREDERASLFQAFGTTSARPTGGESSTGLGLAIAKRIVEGHRGDIGCESQLGVGSTFWLTLPLSGVVETATESELARYPVFVNESQGDHATSALDPGDELSGPSGHEKP